MNTTRQRRGPRPGHLPPSSPPLAPALLALSLFAQPLLARSPLPGPQGDRSDESEQSAPAQEHARTPARRWRAEIGQPAPEFELPRADGGRFRLADQRGKVVVLEWFNPRCPVVRRAHGEGGALAELPGRAIADGVVWVAINSGAPGEQGTGPEENTEGARALGVDYPVLLDESGWVGAAYGAKTTPTMVVIDTRGIVRYLGGHDDGKGRNLVAEALEAVRAGGDVPAPRTRAYGCSVKYSARADVGLVAPDFTLPDLDGEEHTLSDLRGKVVVLEWFNPLCPVVGQAHGEGGSLQGAAERWAERDVVWLAINSGAPGKQGHDPAENRRAAERWHLAHPILRDEAGRVGRAYGATTTPQMFVIDRRGVVVYAGGHESRELPRPVDAALEDVLAGRPVKVARTKNFGCSVKYAKR